MIFATIGSMLPFDRFVHAIDTWAGAHLDEEVFIQTGRGMYKPKNMEFREMLSPTEFAAKVKAASLIIAHAGMGSVIMAAEAGKPILLFPRRAGLGEHTTDHQLHTVGWLKERPGIYIAMDEAELDEKIAQAARHRLDGEVMSTLAPAGFVARLRQEILQ